MQYEQSEAMPATALDPSPVEIEALRVVVGAAADLVLRTEIPIGASVVRLA